MGENASEGAATSVSDSSTAGDGGWPQGRCWCWPALGRDFAGQLATASSRGGPGVPLSGEQQGGGAYTLPDVGNLANFLSGLGLTNQDGTPSIDVDVITISHT
jgi:hypothetical protein